MSCCSAEYRDAHQQSSRHLHSKSYCTLTPDPLMRARTKIMRFMNGEYWPVVAPFGPTTFAQYR